MKVYIISGRRTYAEEVEHIILGEFHAQGFDVNAESRPKVQIVTDSDRLRGIRFRDGDMLALAYDWDTVPDIGEELERVRAYSGTATWWERTFA